MLSSFNPVSVADFGWGCVAEAVFPAGDLLCEVKSRGLHVSAVVTSMINPACFVLSEIAKINKGVIYSFV